MLVSSQKKNTPPPTDENRVLNHSNRHQAESDKSKKIRSAKPPKVETCKNNLQVKGPEGTGLRLRSQRGCIVRQHQRFPQRHGILDIKMGIKQARWRANMLTGC